jgi:hypothetical protein
MNSLKSVVLITALAAGCRAEDVTFTYAPPKAGEKNTQTVETVMDVKVNVKAADTSKTLVQFLQQTTRRRETVLEAGAPTPKKVGVEYLQDDHRSSGTSGDAVQATPIAGKNYIVTLLNGKPRVTDDEGDLPQIPEIEMVGADYFEFGTIPRSIALFKDNTFTVGKKTQIDDKVARGVFVPGGSIRDLVLTLKDVRKKQPFDTAIFAAEMIYEKNDGPLKFEVALKGEIVIGTSNCWPVSIKLDGPVTVSGTEKGRTTGEEITAKGSGNMKHTITTQYGN